MTVLPWVRSMLFQFGYIASVIVWGMICLVVAPVLPYRARFRFVVLCWTGFILWWLKVTCGVTCRIHGRKNIPPRACVVLCNHQSTWETYLLQSLFAPTASVLKRELLAIPFFGWVYRLLQPIPIDRNRPTEALRQLIREGQARLKDGIWVTLLPEGTRVRGGSIGRFRRGGAALAAAAEVPVLCVAHDAGKCWPAGRFLKVPGEIQVAISPPLDTANLSVEEITSAAEAWMRGAMDQLDTMTAPFACTGTPLSQGSDIQVGNR